MRLRSVIDGESFNITIQNLLVSRDGVGYTSQILVTGLSSRGVEDWRKQFELRNKYKM